MVVWFYHRFSLISHDLASCARIVVSKVFRNLNLEVFVKVPKLTNFTSNLNNTSIYLIIFQYIFYVAKYNLWLVGKDIGRARGGLFWKGIHYESTGFKRNFFCPSTPNLKPTELKVFFNKKWNNVGADANIVSCKSQGDIYKTVDFSIDGVAAGKKVLGEKPIGAENREKVIFDVARKDSGNEVKPPPLKQKTVDESNVNQDQSKNGGDENPDQKRGNSPVESSETEKSTTAQSGQLGSAPTTAASTQSVQQDSAQVTESMKNTDLQKFQTEIEPGCCQSLRVNAESCKKE